MDQAKGKYCRTKLHGCRQPVDRGVGRGCGLLWSGEVGLIVLKVVVARFECGETNGYCQGVVYVFNSRVDCVVDGGRDSCVED